MTSWILYLASAPIDPNCGSTLVWDIAVLSVGPRKLVSHHAKLDATCFADRSDPKDSLVRSARQTVKHHFMKAPYDFEACKTVDVRRIGADVGLGHYRP